MDLILFLFFLEKSKSVAEGLAKPLKCRIFAPQLFISHHHAHSFSQPCRRAFHCAPGFRSPSLGHVRPFAHSPTGTRLAGSGSSVSPRQHALQLPPRRHRHHQRRRRRTARRLRRSGLLHPARQHLLPPFSLSKHVDRRHDRRDESRRVLHRLARRRSAISRTRRRAGIVAPCPRAGSGAAALPHPARSP